MRPWEVSVSRISSLLLTPQGRQVLAAARQMANQPVQPATVERLRSCFPADLVSAALVLNSLRVRARDRFRRADGMFFDSADLLEQATSEPVARHKAKRFVGCELVADLCCGAGGDGVPIAEQVGRVLGVDCSAARLACLRANAENAGLRHRVWHVASDIEQWVPDAAAYHIDPPRRDGRGRRMRADECDDWVQAVEALTCAKRHVAGKLSPAVNLDLLAWADEVEFISENGTLKQAVTWAGRLAAARRSATVIRSLAGQTQFSETLGSDEPVRSAEVGPSLSPGRILHEPDPAVVRAGLLGNLAAHLALSWSIRICRF